MGKDQEAERLINDVLEIVRDVLHADHREDLTRRRAQAKKLLTAIEEQERRFLEQHGPDVANPTARAWYLLKQMTEHATLLRKPEA